MVDPTAQVRPPPDSTESGGGRTAAADGRAAPTSTSTDEHPTGRPHRFSTRRRALGGAGLTVLTVLLLIAVVIARRPGPERAAGTPQSANTGASASADPLTRQIEGLQQRLKTQTDDYTGWATLGIAYIQQAKNTVNPLYYPKAGGVLTRSLQLNSADNFVAMVGMSNLKAAEHRFGEALSWAERAKSVAPYNSAVYGALADAYTQLGRYDEAAQAVQRMVDLKPGTPSLARAEYVFELRGQLDQARASMQRALDDATTPADQAFAYYYLGELALAQGDASQALTEHEAGLRADPNYPDLLEGKAKAEAALGRSKDAVRDYAAVVARVPLPQYVIEAGEYLESLGMHKEAQQNYGLFAAENDLFTSNGVQLDVDPTLFYADHGNPALALQYGQAGIRIRPFLDMDDAYAWALHVNHRDAEALSWADKAMATGTRRALFAYHRGMIEKSLGQSAAARHDLSQALALNPTFNPLQAPVARRALAELGGPE